MDYNVTKISESLYRYEFSGYPSFSIKANIEHGEYDWSLVSNESGIYYEGINKDGETIKIGYIT